MTTLTFTNTCQVNIPKDEIDYLDNETIESIRRIMRDYSHTREYDSESETDSEYSESDSDSSDSDSDIEYQRRRNRRHRENYYSSESDTDSEYSSSDSDSDSDSDDEDIDKLLSNPKFFKLMLRNTMNELDNKNNDTDSKIENNDD